MEYSIHVNSRNHFSWNHLWFVTRNLIIGWIGPFDSTRLMFAKFTNCVEGSSNYEWQRNSWFGFGFRTIGTAAFFLSSSASSATSTTSILPWDDRSSSSSTLSSALFAFQQLLPVCPMNSKTRFFSELTDSDGVPLQKFCHSGIFVTRSSFVVVNNAQWS